MKPEELRELILDIVGAKAISPVEIASDLFDVVPRERIQLQINELLWSGQLQLTEENFVRIPIAVCIADNQDGLGDRGLSGLPNASPVSKGELCPAEDRKRPTADHRRGTKGR